MRWVRVGLLAVAIASGSGCKQRVEEIESPVGAYLSFARAAQKNPEAAYEALSADSKKKIAASAQALSEATAGAVENNPAEIFFAPDRRASPLDPTSVKLGKLAGEVAHVTVSADGGERQVQMIREQGRWRVDLVAVLP